MAERVHFRSWTLGRAFTFSEWCAYLKEHADDTSKTVLNYHGFEFNVHGACLNPHRKRHYNGSDGRVWFEIETWIEPADKTTLSNPVWCYCVHHNDYTMGGHFVSGRGLASERECISEAMRKAKNKYLEYARQHEAQKFYHGDYPEESFKPSSVAQRCRAMAKVCEQVYNDNLQLTLF